MKNTLFSPPLYLCVVCEPLGANDNLTVSDVGKVTLINLGARDNRRIHTLGVCERSNEDPADIRWIKFDETHSKP
jgi:hypothetical protein